jgi:hypothetical protein
MNVKANQDRYYELSFNTLSKHDNSFIHQHIVDAFCAQTADDSTKTISLIFSLVGLYLMVEKNFSGKQVQNVHGLMAKQKKDWQRITLPVDRGTITVANVVSVNEGIERDTKIKEWCVSVWNAYADNRILIKTLSDEFLF